MIIPMTLEAPRNLLLLRRQKDQVACYDRTIFANVPEFQKQLLNIVSSTPQGLRLRHFTRH